MKKWIQNIWEFICDHPTILVILISIIIILSGKGILFLIYGNKPISEIPLWVYMALGLE